MELRWGQVGKKHKKQFWHVLGKSCFLVISFSNLIDIWVDYTHLHLFDFQLSFSFSGNIFLFCFFLFHFFIFWKHLSFLLLSFSLFGKYRFFYRFPTLSGATQPRVAIHPPSHPQLSICNTGYFFPSLETRLGKTSRFLRIRTRLPDEGKVSLEITR